METFLNMNTREINIQFENKTIFNLKIRQFENLKMGDLKIFVLCSYVLISEVILPGKILMDSLLSPVGTNFW